MTWSFPQDLSRAVSRCSRGPVAGNHRQHFFDPAGLQSHTGPVEGNHLSTFSIHLGYNPMPDKKTLFSIRSEIVMVFDPAGSKKCWRWFPATGPLEKLEAALGRSWGENSKLLWGEEDQFETFSGQKLMPTYWKVSTDWRSNCIRIGLKFQNHGFAS